MLKFFWFWPFGCKFRADDFTAGLLTLKTKFDVFDNSSKYEIRLSAFTVVRLIRSRLLTFQIQMKTLRNCPENLVKMI